jgi:hypothetical protein
MSTYSLLKLDDLIVDILFLNDDILVVFCMIFECFTWVFYPVYHQDILYYVAMICFVCWALKYYNSWVGV